MVKAPTAGYSGTPLRKKLGVVTTQVTWRLAMPEAVAGEIDSDGLPMLVDEPVAGVGMAHLFVTEATALREHLARLRPLLAPNGMVWVSWPKQASKVQTDITENIIRALALPMGFVDVKVCAVDVVWSGLKLVIRVSERG
jgi:hypothetical protein